MKGFISVLVAISLTLFSASAYAESYPSKNIVYQGEAGAGQHTKMSNQIAIAAGMLGV